MINILVIILIHLLCLHVGSNDSKLYNKLDWCIYTTYVCKTYSHTLPISRFLECVLLKIFETIYLLKKRAGGIDRMFVQLVSVGQAM